MEDENNRGKLSNFIFSDTKRKMTLAGVWCVGFILIVISLLMNFSYYQFIMALGVSLSTGIPIGLFVGYKIGWPLGLWSGLIGGLMISPLLALLISGRVSAYYASFLGPFPGALAGRWTELTDKKRLKEDIESIRK